MTIFSTLATFGTADTPSRILERGKQNRGPSPAMNWTILLKLNYFYIILTHGITLAFLHFSIVHLVCCKDDERVILILSAFLTYLS